MDKKRKPERKTKKAKVSEYFKIEKEGENKIIRREGVLDEPVTKKGQVEKEKKQLIIILIICGVILGLFIGWFLISGVLNKFEINGVVYDIVRAGDVRFYHTSFPIKYKGKLMNYNVYIRNNPLELMRDVPFDGNLLISELVVINMSDEKRFKCDGYGIIAISNLNQILEDTVKTKVVKDPQAECIKEGIYTFINIKEGEKTRITETGPGCYEIEIKDCEILEGTERFIVEIVDAIDKKRK